MWSSTVGLVNGKHRYLTAETFGFKINSNGQALKRRQQWTIEPFGGCPGESSAQNGHIQPEEAEAITPGESKSNILTLNPSSGATNSSLISIRSSSNGSSSSEADRCNGQAGLGEEHENVAIKSHLNKYLAVDSFGNVTCDSDEKSENARFTITICSMSQSRSEDEHIFWAFKNVARGYYLGTSSVGNICCEAKVPKSRAELWHLHLLPARGASFFSLRSLGRKRVARTVPERDCSTLTPTSGQAEPRGNGQVLDDQQTGSQQVQLDATLSWGPNTLFQFEHFEGGRYALLTSDRKYLSNSGRCTAWRPSSNSSDELPPAECLFSLEYHSGFLAFRDCGGLYLAGAGRSSVLCSRSAGVSRDELFSFEPAPIQVALRCTLNGRWLSTRQGVDLSANQTEPSSNHETFQMNFERRTQTWTIMTHGCDFWSVSRANNTICVRKPEEQNTSEPVGHFKLIWSDTDSTCSFKSIELASQQERWICARKSGQLFATTGSGSGGPSQPAKFIMRFQNRCLLNLRPVDGNGFVGARSCASNLRQLDANKTKPDSIAIEYSSWSPGCAQNSAPQMRCSPQVGPKPKLSLLNECPNKGPSSTDELANIHNHVESIRKLQLDDNNNNIEDGVMFDANFDTQAKVTLPDDLAGVETSSTPSVSTIIKNFAGPKSETADDRKQHQVAANLRVSAMRQQFQQVPSKGSNLRPMQMSLGTKGNPHQAPQNSSVLKLASSFETSQQQTSSVISTCPDADCTRSVISSSEQQSEVALSEHCFLKILSMDRYLVVGENDSGIVCDATNKACAQAWILELRGHNSVAIRASDNQAYMQLGSNNTIYLSKCEPKDASLWEF